MGRRNVRGRGESNGEGALTTVVVVVVVMMVVLMVVLIFNHPAVARWIHEFPMGH